MLTVVLTVNHTPSFWQIRISIREIEIKVLDFDKEHLLHIYDLSHQRKLRRKKPSQNNMQNRVREQDVDREGLTRESTLVDVRFKCEMAMV